mgnify:CR=1 FL=1
MITEESFKDDKGNMVTRPIIWIVTADEVLSEDKRSSRFGRHQVLNILDTTGYIYYDEKGNIVDYDNSPRGNLIRDIRASYKTNTDTQFYYDTNLEVTEIKCYLTPLDTEYNSTNKDQVEERFETHNANNEGFFRKNKRGEYGFAYYWTDKDGKKHNFVRLEVAQVNSRGQVEYSGTDDFKSIRQDLGVSTEQRPVLIVMPTPKGKTIRFYFDGLKESMPNYKEVFTNSCTTGKVGQLII